LANDILAEHFSSLLAFAYQKCDNSFDVEKLAFEENMKELCQKRFFYPKHLCLFYMAIFVKSSLPQSVKCQEPWTNENVLFMMGH